MAYECPVCTEVNADGEHLANHLAVTASLHEDDHAAWLAEQVPDWPERSPAELGEAVLDHARERDVEDSPASHEHGAGGRRPSFEATLDRQGGDGRTRDRETERVLREARELTERMAPDAESAEDPDEPVENGESEGA
jgi:hypothetical protein